MQIIFNLFTTLFAAAPVTNNKRLIHIKMNKKQAAIYRYTIAVKLEKIVQQTAFRQFKKTNSASRKKKTPLWRSGVW
ncbi:MAG TPA: hypothetical protein VFT06_12355 [Flavisolibacter sp.]|nr:hypothetical protein [Flavisolibacter sp.]